MRINQIHLERFKRFSNLSLKFPEKTANGDVTLIVGDNGSGKSTILQAIAATLGTATSQIGHPQELDWPGFDVSYLSANYQDGVSKVAISASFSKDEVVATRELYEKSEYRQNPNSVLPGDDLDTELEWVNAPGRSPVVRGKSVANYFQFQGRRYALNLIYNKYAQPNMFERIGSVFWYNEQRTSYTLAPFIREGTPGNGRDPIIQIDSEQAVRNLLARWFGSKPAKGTKKSNIEKFNQYYSRLFLDRRLDQLGETFGASKAPVYFQHGNLQYDLSELSGGERALMPILLDFVEWDINNSVILIDELELHLHPALQQAFLALLPQLGHNNQYIITTHSDAIAGMVLEDSIIRMSDLG